MGAFRSLPLEVTDAWFLAVNLSFQGGPACRQAWNIEDKMNCKLVTESGYFQRGLRFTIFMFFEHVTRCESEHVGVYFIMKFITSKMISSCILGGVSQSWCWIQDFFFYTDFRFVFILTVIMFLLLQEMRSLWDRVDFRPMCFSNPSHWLRRCGQMWVHSIYWYIYPQSFQLHVLEHGFGNCSRHVAPPPQKDFL
jgi:hypothetical protein